MKAQREPTTAEAERVYFPYSSAEIAGRNWQQRGPGTYVRALPPHTDEPNASAITPHPTRYGWRIAWLFLGTCVALAVYLWPYIKALLPCLAVAVPLWVCR